MLKAAKAKTFQTLTTLKALMVTVCCLTLQNWFSVSFNSIIKLIEMGLSNNSSFQNYPVISSIIY